MDDGLKLPFQNLFFKNPVVMVVSTGSAEYCCNVQKRREPPEGLEPSTC